MSFEIARRHRFAREMAELPDDVEAHVLPSGRTSSARRLPPRAPRFRRVQERIERYEASAAYLAEHL